MRKRGRKEETMGRTPCCNKGEVKKGAWTPEEDKILVDYIMKNGHGTWRSFPKLAGLRRCGKSCRLRWTNYLRPDIKRGDFSYEEEQTIFHLHTLHGNRWATIASQLPGRTDNEIKNYWNSHLRKRIPQKNHTLKPEPLSKSTNTKHNYPPWENITKDTETEIEISVDPMILSPTTGISCTNSFLHEWSSGGDGEEEFQKHTTNLEDLEKMEFCAIPTTPKKIKFETESYFVGTSTSESCDQGIKVEEITESQNSYEAENASDITLDLLLDFPNDGEYLEYV